MMRRSLAVRFVQLVAILALAALWSWAANHPGRPKRFDARGQCRTTAAVTPSPAVTTAPLHVEPTVTAKQAAAPSRGRRPLCATRSDDDDRRRSVRA